MRNLRSWNVGWGEGCKTGIFTKKTCQCKIKKSPRLQVPLVPTYKIWIEHFRNLPKTSINFCSCISARKERKFKMKKHKLMKDLDKFISKEQKLIWKIPIVVNQQKTLVKPKCKLICERTEIDFEEMH